MLLWKTCSSWSCCDSMLSASPDSLEGVKDSICAERQGGGNGSEGFVSELAVV